MSAPPPPSSTTTSSGGAGGVKRTHEEMEAPRGTPAAASQQPRPAGVGTASAAVPPAKKPNTTGSSSFSSGAPVTTPAPPATTTTTTGAAQPANMPKVGDALHYLEKVKSRFSSQPHVYNQFLDIMKDFKSQAIDTDGVIRRVKHLFRGHRSLILGFNQFLPPGYRIELERPTIEFKQAMEYVAKIKSRFKDEPYIYAEFLDILHDYQAKRTIDEVYTRVQKLFSGHKDLLEEFKYFLPESAINPRTTKTPAVSRPDPAAKKPDYSRAKLGPTASKDKVDPNAKRTSTSTSNSKTGGSGKPVDNKVGSSNNKQASLDPKKMVGGKSNVPSTKDRSKEAGGPSSHHRETRNHGPRVTYPPGSEKELQLFERMKNQSTKPQWLQLLKVLNLFAQDIINRGELIRMVEDIYGGGGASTNHLAQDWIDKFKTTIGYDEAEEKQCAAMTQTNYYAFVSSVDFTVCHQVTPSYRELPTLIQVPHASGRTALADEVLNDTCISIPTGSEDFSFKSTRKNIYEENLFKCEDERFELDMLIENNAAAIRVLEPLVDQIALLSPENAKRVRLPDTIDILHIRAIARVYAEQGYEMIELLNKSPAITMPIILIRLKQKDLEWRKIRNEMKSTWRKVNEQNYQRSLDHRSFYFKQEDKKRRSPKALVIELREVHQAVFGGAAATTTSTSSSSAPTTREGKKVLPLLGSEDLTGEESLMLRAIRQGQPPNPLYNYCMRFKYGDSTIHVQLFDLVAKVAGLILSSEIEQLKLLEFFATFVNMFFGQELTEGQKQKLQAMEERVAAEEEKRQQALMGSDEEEKSGAAMNFNNSATPAHSDASATPAQAAAGEHDDEEAGAKEDQDEEMEDAAAAPAVAAVTTSAPSRTKGKKKTKKKAASKKKVTPVIAKPSMTQPKEEEDDEDDDKEEKKEEDDLDDANGGSARQRAIAAAKQAANQLNVVRSLMTKVRASSEINADGVTPGTTRPLQLHYDTPWMRKEQSLQAPVSSSAAASSSSTASNTTSSMRKHGRSSHFFFGSHAYYVFFRLHSFAYERLLTAKTLAHKARRNSSKKKLPATPEEKHARFNQILDSLFQGEIEASKFEDECRNLLGASSYVLFTIDKLIEQLVKQTCQLLSSDNGLKVLALYQYEQRRMSLCQIQAKKAGTSQSVVNEQLSILARQYQSNLSQLLGDDSVCCVEYFHDSSELAIGLIEHLDLNNRHLPGEEWSQFVKEYLDSIPGEVKVVQPFRKRTMRLVKRGLVKQSGGNIAQANKIAHEALLALAMRYTYMKSSLQSKFDLRSFKLHFVEHTTDVLVRAVGKAKESEKQSRVELRKKATQRFRTWLTKRLSELAPMAAENAAGALGSMLGFGDEGTYDAEEDTPMEPSAEAPQDETFGALTAAADAEEVEEEEEVIEEDAME